MVGMLIGCENYIATPSTVTAIRPALGYKFLTSKAYASPPALSGLGKDFDTINKHGAGNCHSAPALSSPSKSRTQRAALSKLPTYSNGTSARGSAEHRPTKDHPECELVGRDSVEPEIKGRWRSG